MSLQIPEIISLASAFYGSSVLFSALELDLFTAIAESNDPTVEALADTLSVDTRGLRLLLDAAVATGLLTKSDLRYALTPATQATLVRAICYFH